MEQAWAFIDTIEEAWAEKETRRKLCNYPAGSWGPEEADELLARDGRSLAEIMMQQRHPSGAQSNDPVAELSAHGSLDCARGDLITMPVATETFTRRTSGRGRPDSIAS